MIAGVGKIIAITLLAALKGPMAGHHPIRVTLVVIYASPNNDRVDPRLTTLAGEVKKLEPTLTGFRIATSLQKSIPVGGVMAFDLPDRQVCKVSIDKPKDKANRVGLSVEPPGLGEITYTCMCDKFFPIVTPFKNTDGERMIITVMAKPCPGK